MSKLTKIEELTAELKQLKALNKVLANAVRSCEIIGERSFGYWIEKPTFDRETVEKARAALGETVLLGQDKATLNRREGPTFAP